MATTGTGGRAVGAFTAITGVQVDTRQVTALGRTQLIVSRDTSIDTCLNLRVHIQRLLHGLGQGLGLNETGGENERYCLKQVQTHLRIPRTSCLKSQQLGVLR